MCIRDSYFRGAFIDRTGGERFVQRGLSARAGDDPCFGTDLSDRERDRSADQSETDKTEFVHVHRALCPFRKCSDVFVIRQSRHNIMNYNDTTVRYCIGIAQCH